MMEGVGSWCGKNRASPPYLLGCSRSDSLGAARVEAAPAIVYSNLILLLASWKPGAPHGRPTTTPPRDPGSSRVLSDGRALGRAGAEPGALTTWPFSTCWPPHSRDARAQPQYRPPFHFCVHTAPSTVYLSSGAELPGQLTPLRHSAPSLPLCVGVSWAPQVQGAPEKRSSPPPPSDSSWDSFSILVSGSSILGLLSPNLRTQLDRGLSLPTLSPSENPKCVHRHPPRAGHPLPWLSASAQLATTSGLQ